MPDLLLRNIDPDLKRRLAEQAKRHKRSLSAEATAILAETLAPKPEKGLGTQLVELFEGLGGDDLDLEYDELPGEPPDFSDFK
jgi:plasmid stability protein